MSLTFDYNFISLCVKALDFPTAHQIYVSIESEPRDNLFYYVIEGKRAEESDALIEKARYFGKIFRDFPESIMDLSEKCDDYHIRSFIEQFKEKKEEYESSQPSLHLKVNQSRKLEEIMSWRLTTELWRRSPKQFDLIEAHPCTGQYDCLVLMTKGKNPTFGIDVNREGGSVHVHKDAFGSNGMPMYSDWLSRMLDGDPTRLLDEICKEARIDVPSKLPPSTPATITYRYIADFLSHSINRKEKWYCLNGYCDSSGMLGCYVRKELFDKFPGLQDRRLLEECPERQGVYEYSYWFLIKDGEPELCLDINGRLFKKNGESHDLFGLYKKTKSIWAVISKTAGETLP